MPYTFEFTQDVALIKSILAHPACYRFLHDDFAVPREDWEPLMGNSLVKYLACREDGELIGMFLCSLHSAVEVEMHTAFLPSSWGRDVRPAARAGIEWVWNTFPTIQRIIGKALPSNRASVRYAEAVGMQIFGIDERSFMFGCKLQDQIYFGISRPEAV
jgi:RimJ/RimL family protein N-acetyltransferase